jgi:hypothetical protein
MIQNSDAKWTYQVPLYLLPATVEPDEPAEVDGARSPRQRLRPPMAAGDGRCCCLGYPPLPRSAVMAAAPPPGLPFSIVCHRALLTVWGKGWGRRELGIQRAAGGGELGSMSAGKGRWGTWRGDLRTGAMGNGIESSRSGSCLSLARAQDQAHEADGFAPGCLRK